MITELPRPPAALPGRGRRRRGRRPAGSSRASAARNRCPAESMTFAAYTPSGRSTRSTSAMNSSSPGGTAPIGSRTRPRSRCRPTGRPGRRARAGASPISIVIDRLGSSPISVLDHVGSARRRSRTRSVRARARRPDVSGDRQRPAPEVHDVVGVPAARARSRRRGAGRTRSRGRADRRGRRSCGEGRRGRGCRPVVAVLKNRQAVVARLGFAR